MTQVENPMARPIVEPRTVFACERCRNGLYAHEQIFQWEDKWICDDCFSDALHSMTLADKADAMGVEVRLALDEA